MGMVWTEVASQNECELMESGTAMWAKIDKSIEVPRTLEEAKKKAVRKLEGYSMSECKAGGLLAKGLERGDRSICRPKSNKQ